MNIKLERLETEFLVSYFNQAIGANFVVGEFVNVTDAKIYMERLGESGTGLDFIITDLDGKKLT